MKKLFCYLFAFPVLAVTGYADTSQYPSPLSRGFQSDGSTREDYYNSNGSRQGYSVTIPPRPGFQSDGSNRIEYYDSNGFRQGYSETVPTRHGFGG